MTHQLLEPDWVRTWREQDLPTPLNPESALAAVTAVRDGDTFEGTLDVSGLEVKQLLSLVTGVGSRCAQISKNHGRIVKIELSNTGAASFERGPDPDDPDVEGWHVDAAPGWLRTRRAGDVRRAYAALLVADAEVAAEALTRTLDAERVDVQVSYTHYADLHGASRGVLPPLHEVVSVPAAAAGYLDAWEHLNATVADATAAVRELLAHPNVDEIERIAARAFWLVPNVGVLARWARTARSAPDGASRLNAERRIGSMILSLRHMAARSPHRVLPTKLEHLTIVQVRAIAATRGMHPADGVAAREESAWSLFASEAAKALSAHRDEIFSDHDAA